MEIMELLNTGKIQAETNQTVVKEPEAQKQDKEKEDEEVSSELVRSVRQSFVEDEIEINKFWKEKRLSGQLFDREWQQFEMS